MDVYEALQERLKPHIAFAIEAVREDPIHIAVEAALVLFISYILLVKRTYDPAKKCAGAEEGE
jgi:hypothetical protein